MKKKIEIKNYVILLLIIVITLFAVLYARSWYITGQEYRDNNSIMTSVVSQISEDEITSCLSENPNAVIYASSGEDTNVKSFEKDFIKLVSKYNLSEQLLYVNLDASSDSFMETLKSFAKSSEVADKVSNTSASLYIFKEGKLDSVIADTNEIGVKQVEKLLKEYGVIDGE